MPEVVAGSVAGVITIAGFTTSENCWVVEAVTESVSATVNVAVVGKATAAGVPLITPAALSDIPAGRAPVDRLHAKGAVPPLPLRVRLQDVPAVHACSGLALMDGAGLIVKLKLRLPVSLAESVAVALAAKVPEAAGVPAIPDCTPVAGLGARPAGRPPSVQV